jgi:sodium-dependent dicarboxylate transporter 2/3/5
MFLLRLPIVAALLIFTFRPEVTDMSRAISRLRTQVSMQGPVKMSEWLTIAVFLATIASWVAFSTEVGWESLPSAVRLPSSCWAWCAGKISIPG